MSPSNASPVSTVAFVRPFKHSTFRTASVINHQIIIITKIVVLGNSTPLHFCVSTGTARLRSSLILPRFWAMNMFLETSALTSIRPDRLGSSSTVTRYLVDGLRFFIWISVELVTCAWQRFSSSSHELSQCLTRNSTVEFV